MTTEIHKGSFWASPKRIFGTTNAQEIGLLYFVSSLINMAIAGMYALMIRVELWDPNPSMFGDSISYNTAFTLHGTAMVFLVIVPLGAGFGNLLIPRMVASVNADMYWPKWNNFAFWLIPFGSILIWSSQAYAGWTAYAPLSLITAGIDLWILGLVLIGVSSSIGSLNFILTIWKGKPDYVEWFKMDMFVWGTLFTSILLLLTTPVISIALFMVFMDRNMGTNFYNADYGNPVMYQHLFWFFAHPEVYVLLLPAASMTTMFIAKFSRRPVFGYKTMMAAMFSIVLMAFIVWAHHMYTTGIDPFVRFPFNFFTYIIAVPSGVLTFFWIFNMFKGKISFEAPMLFAISFILMFTIGGITGEFLNDLPLDFVLQDTYWVVGHFHFVVAASILTSLFGAFYYYFPDMTGGKMYNKKMAKFHFATWITGSLTTFLGFTMLGVEGMPRRYYTYPARFQFWHQVSTIGAFLMGLGFIFFLIAMVRGYLGNDIVDDINDPFGLGTTAYDFPKPFAEHMKETGVEIHEHEHKLSFMTPLGAIAVIFPLLSLAAFYQAGPFRDSIIAEERGFFSQYLAPDVWGTIFIGIFLVYVVALFIYESGKKVEHNELDQYKKDRHWEMWAFLSSEVIFFATLIGISLAIRMRATDWPAPHEYLDVNLTAVNTFILIISSYTMAMAVNSIKKGDQKKLIMFLGATLALGLTFISIQASEYIKLFEEGNVSLAEDAKFKLFSSTFFIQTGFHGLHVIIGLLFLTFVLLRAIRGGYSKENHEYVEYIGLYWHFVDLAWVFLFTILYLF